MRVHHVLLVLLAGLFLSAANGGEELAHAIYVKVNGKTITQESVVDAVKYLIQREYNGTVPHDEQELENVQQAALRDLVRTILIHDEAAANGVRVDRNYSRQTIAQSGLKPEDITPTIRRMLEADDLFDDLMMAAGTPVRSPSPREMKQFYNDHRDEFRSEAVIIVRTIFIAFDGNRPQSFFRDRAEGVIRELEAVPVAQRTEAFAKKAGEVSEDIFAQFGGLITADNPDAWIPKDFDNLNAEGKEIFPQSMVDAIRRLNRKGDLRLAVSEDGMHIMYCEDLRGGKVMGWDEASRIIDYVLRQQSRNERMRAWLGRVYDRSDVRWHDGSVYDKSELTQILLPSERGRRP